MKTHYYILSLAFLIIFSLGTKHGLAQQLAFPGAEGFGKYATGGRGGKVVEVANLNDAGPGSFRQAFLEYPGEPITIVFRVSGIIQLQSQIKVNRSNFTVAGQTAPGDGICISGHSFIINGARALSQGGNHGNIIIRYLRSRPGYVGTTGVYGFDMENCHNVIVDHCSFSWANEEVAAMYDTKFVTVQWSIMSEGLYNAGHAKGVRSYAGVWGGQYSSFHHNLIANNNSRTIRFNGARAHDTIALIDYRNNVIYNWGSSSASYGGEVEIAGGKSQVNVVNNYFKPGPATPTSGLKFFQASYNATSAKGIGEWYVAGNVMHGSSTLTSNNTAGIDLSKLPIADRPQAVVAAPFAVKETVPTTSAEEAYEQVLTYAGAILPIRDAVDLRIVNETRTRTALGIGSLGSSKAGIIDSPANVGGWPEYNTYAVPADTDQDGMPDAWETQNGLNPQDPEDRNADRDNDGYTSLEEYLNAVAILLAVPEKSFETLRVYPIPTGANLIIDKGELVKGVAKLEVLTLAGKIVYSEKVNPAFPTGYNLNVSFLKPGTYLLRLVEGQTSFTARFVKL